MSTALRVLIVDDDSADRMLMRRELTKALGPVELVEPTTAEAFAGALSALACEIAITDYRLGWTDGLAVLAAVKKAWPDCAVVMFTGTGSEEIAVEAMKNGLDDYVLKSPKHALRIGVVVSRVLELARQRKLAEEAERKRRAAESSFRILVDTSPESVFIATENGILYANLAAKALVEPLGIADPVGKRLADLVDARDRDTVAARGAGPPSATPLEVRIDKRIVELVDADASFEGRPARIVVARDVTERRALQARMAVADRLYSTGLAAASIAHEINNPLAYVVANLSFLRRQADDAASGMKAAAPSADVVEALDSAIEGAQRINEIVRDLRSFSMDGIGETQRGDPRRALELALRIAAAPLTSVTVSLELSPPPAVPISESRLAQVLVNLLINAAQALGEVDSSRRSITIRVRSQDDGGAVFEVADRGRGIIPEHRARIFDAFFTTRAASDGTGLGLAISKRLIEEAGGRMEVETESEKGTVFRITLPPVAAN